MTLTSWKQYWRCPGLPRQATLSFQWHFILYTTIPNLNQGFRIHNFYWLSVLVFSLYRPASLQAHEQPWWNMGCGARSVATENANAAEMRCRVRIPGRHSGMASSYSSHVMPCLSLAVAQYFIKTKRPPLIAGSLKTNKASGVRLEDPRRKSMLGLDLPSWCIPSKTWTCS